MKRPGWLSGSGGSEEGTGKDDPSRPGDDGDASSEETARAEAARARAERRAARRRLAALASETEGGSAASTQESAKPSKRPKLTRRQKPADEVEEPKKPAKPAVEAEEAPGSAEGSRKPERPAAKGPKPAARSKKPAGKPSGDEKPAKRARPARRPSPRAGERKGTGRRRGAKRDRSAAFESLGGKASGGLKSARARSQGLPTRIGKVALGGLGAVYAIFFDLLGFVLNLLIAVAVMVIVPARIVGRLLARALRAAAAIVTPVRALAALVAGAAVLLALSQFADGSSISVGTDAYAEVETVAPAPEKVRDETGTAHAYLMVPLAIVCLALLALAVAGRRWRLCRAIAAAGVIAILVSLLVDRSAGLDTGGLEQQYDGVEAHLLGGFYAQLFAGLLLTLGALLLGRELKLAPEPEAASKRSKRRAKRPVRKSPPPEGARA